MCSGGDLCNIMIDWGQKYEILMAFRAGRGYHQNDNLLTN